MNADEFPREKSELHTFLKPFGSSVVWVDGVFTEKAMSQLYHVCDTYISLHRSEGYGLTILRSMSIGKPVVVTAYSGNMDFCTDQNCILVPVAKQVPIPKEDSVYGELHDCSGCFWAQPDVVFAASALYHLYSNDGFRHASAAAYNKRSWSLPDAILPPKN